MRINTPQAYYDTPIEDHGCQICSLKKIPNKTTKKSMQNAMKRKTIQAKDFEDLCNKLVLLPRNLLH